MKKCYIMLILLCTAVILQADPVSHQKAKQIATTFYRYICKPSVIDYEVSSNTEGWYKEMLTYYTFKFKSGGYVIVAADDASIPILGYSNYGTIQNESMSPATSEWLEGYSNQIYEIVEARLSNRETLLQWNAILQENFPTPTRDVDQLLTTTWGQGSYYNELCPSDPAGPGGHVPTGCVATAMAQIMKYHDFPPQGVGSHSYLIPVYGVQSVDFGNTTYDWASMPDSVIESNIAVATIMYHAGVAVDMIYGPYQTGTYNELIPNAFIDYFNYNPELQIHYQSDYTDPDDWKYLLRADLDEQLPVYYSGIGPAGGHAFVCDGYSLSDEKFHFNWGWNGSYDGWYIIGALNPGGLTWNQYNTAILGIKPYNPDFVVRITKPVSNELICAENPVNIEAIAEIGNPDQIKITIDGETVATGNSNTLVFTWNTTNEDCGSHEVKAWAIMGNDSVYHQINLNVSNRWIEQSSGFQTPLRMVSYISAVDENVAWAIPRDGIYEWGTEIQEFTRTSDGGSTWTAGTIPDCEGLWALMVYAISEMKAYIPMFRSSGTKPKGIYVTMDGGSTWNRQVTASFSSPYSFPVCVHFFNENDGFCLGDPIFQDGGWEFEIYTTTDAGVNWVALPAENKPNPLSSQEESGPIYSAVNDTIWFGTSKGRIFKSVDKGYNWTVATVPGMEEHWTTPVFRTGSHGLVHNFVMQYDLIVNGPGAIYETFDSGETWTPIIPQGPMYWTDLAYVPGTENMWVSTGGHIAFEHGASYSTDGGHTWTAYPGTEGTKFRQMAWVNENCGWAGGYSLNDTVGGMYKFSVDTLNTVIPVNELKETKVKVFPNPLTASTTIQYDLKQSSTVQITIFNSQGKLLEVIRQTQSQGTQQVTWNAEVFPPGVYCFTLQTGDHVASGKMVVVK